MKPITPEEVLKVKSESIPDAVFEAFNELIAENYNGSSSTVKQNKVVALILKKLNDTDPGHNFAEVLRRHWLDVEDIYRKAGWSVEYNNPAPDENYEAYFEFTRDENYEAYFKFKKK